ncbi:MAG: chemotaxis protein CheX [Smithellaceae bacterium]
MNVNVINAFIEASIHVLKTMAFIDATAGKPFLKEDGIAIGDVSGIIGFSGSMMGSLALSFTEPCILRIVSNMLGEEINNINRMSQDAAGEITNMISGDARKRMQSKGLIVAAGIPTVVSGKAHEIKHTLSGPSIIIPFSTDFGSFVVDVNIREKK